MADNKKWSFSQGIFSHNPIFAAGMFLAPVIFIGNNLNNAITFAAIFSSVTILTLMTASFMPKKLPYGGRIILYTVIAAVIFVPLCIFFEGKLPSEPAKLGVFLPMIVTGEFITGASEFRFFRMKKGQMMADIISHIIGYDAGIIFLGAFRELFSSGGIDGTLYGIRFTIPLLSAPCGGFILIGLLGALIRLFKKDKEEALHE